VTKKKRPDVDEVLGGGWDELPPISPFPIESFQGEKSPASDGWALARAMDAASNPWTVLGTRQARLVLARLWERAREGEPSAVVSMGLFIELLSPPVRRGRPRTKEQSKRTRQEAAGLLDQLTSAILAGDTSESNPSLAPFFEWLQLIDGAWFGAKGPKLVALPEPACGPTKTRKAARDKAGRFFASIVATMENTFPLANWGDYWHVLNKWSPTPIGVPGEVTRRRLSRARRNGTKIP